jgi:DNA-binding CsgD family transcriptional regulator
VDQHDGLAGAVILVIDLDVGVVLLADGDCGHGGFLSLGKRPAPAMPTGDTVRKRTVETVSELTAQEAHIARLAVDGRTNVEIGAQLFLSTRTVEWHLGKVYAKLGVGSRRELRQALGSLGQADPPA